MKELNKDQKYLIISGLGSWYSPDELRQLFGIKYNEIYYYCNKYGIPKSREFKSEQRQSYLNEFENWREEERGQRLEEVKGQLGI